MHTVLYVHHSSQVSGAERSMLEIIGRLAGRCEIIVACPPDGPLPALIEAAGARVAPAPLVRFKRTLCPVTLSRYISARRTGIRALVRIIRETGASIVHANTTTACLYAGPAAKRCGLPLVWHIRDLAVPRIARFGLPPRYAPIAISSFVAERVAARTGMPPEVIHNGIRLDAYHPAAVAPIEPVVMMVGQLVPWKGHRDFLCAAAIVYQALAAARFDIVGADLFNDHPGYSDKLAEITAELGITDAVRFAGYRDDIPDALRTASLLVLPSRNEPFGRIVVEAMATGLPVVAYNEGGPAEIIVDGETGLLVEPGNVDELAIAIASVLVDPRRAARMRQAGRKRAEQYFDSCIPARKILAVYDRLAGEQP